MKEEDTNDLKTSYIIAFGAIAEAVDNLKKAPESEYIKKAIQILEEAIEKTEEHTDL